MPLDESDRRAAAGEPFVVRFRVPRESPVDIRFNDLVYGPQSKSTADIEDFALLRSNGMPTYHMASCADDADLRISHIVRGQDHLTNTFKHILIFEALNAQPAGVRAPASADRSRRRQAVEAQARPGGERHHLPRRGLSAARLREFHLSAGMVAEGRSRTDDARRIGGGVLFRRRQPRERGGQLQRGRPVRPQGRVAERGVDPHHARARTCVGADAVCCGAQDSMSSRAKSCRSRR